MQAGVGGRSRSIGGSPTECEEKAAAGVDLAQVCPGLWRLPGGDEHAHALGLP
jgi:hypothetical protein